MGGGKGVDETVNVAKEWLEAERSFALKNNKKKLASTLTPNQSRTSRSAGKVGCTLASHTGVHTRGGGEDGFELSAAAAASALASATSSPSEAAVRAATLMRAASSD